MSCYFIYSSGYYADIGEHVFPILKYRLLYERLVNEGIITKSNLLTPQPATNRELLLVHTKYYVADLLSYTHSPRTRDSELPINKEIVDAFLLSAGGSILAAQQAFSTGCAFNLGGGFHHAFPDHAEGFCYLNDVAIAIRSLQQEFSKLRVLIIDGDLHQGNGNAYIFMDDPSVFTFSIHQENNYPLKEKSDRDIGLPDSTTDEQYLANLESAIPEIIQSFRPQFVFYLAGADPYCEDQLGALSLSIQGLAQRDEFVKFQCQKHSLPLAVVLAGGYALNTEDTITIHANTARILHQDETVKSG